MTLELVSGAPEEGAPVEVRGVFSGLEPASGTLGAPDTLSWHGFAGALGETLRRDTGPSELLVGLGPRDRLGAETLRRVGAAIARAATHAPVLSCSLEGIAPPGLDEAAVAEAIGEGALLASYRFERYRSTPSEQTTTRLHLHGSDGAAISSGIERAIVIGEAVALARDLVNTPGSDLTPVRFAEIATEVAGATGLEIEVLDEEAIARERLGGILTVARGSQQPPRLVRVAYRPPGAPADAPTLYLVGKGITFDSGGLAIKPAAGMMTMKTDMSGAAAVLAACSALGRLGAAVPVVGLMPLTENMSGGNAVKPGDVLRARNGKTIEVLNPDAEGRLVLADALSLAVEGGADAIVDLATLTGACVQALGARIAGLMGNDDRAIAAVARAAASAGEPVWPLPLPAGYRDHIESEVADMKNIGAGNAGALSAGLLLEEFVAQVPWVHLDIAGPARSSEDGGYLRKGGTGFGVRTLLALVADYRPLGGATVGEPVGRVVFE